MKNKNKGIIKILQTEPETNIVSGHDQIWLGNPDSPEYSEADKSDLRDLGFFEDEESWSCFV